MKNVRSLVLVSLAFAGLPAVGIAEPSPWDRNAMFVGTYECEAKIKTGATYDAETKAWVTETYRPTGRYKIELEELTGDDEIGRLERTTDVSASQYGVRIYDRDDPNRISTCISNQDLEHHGMFSVTILKDGRLECYGGFGIGSPISTFHFNFKTGRYMWVGDYDTYINDEIKPADEPFIEMGTCQQVH
ncbi:hypothetical protein [Rhizobium leguminosarum]|uniref:hypothetical protein n=1 Tax=Rhizobium leguminosarum TaxID=384 RepID=UPI003F983225